MKFIEVKADKFLYYYSKITGTGGKAKMGAFYPFIFTTNKIHPNMRPYFINHELIHLQQQKETLIIGQIIVSFFEFLYFKIIKKNTGMNAYILKNTEQEAYDNMFNLDYLKTRKHYSNFKNYFYKKPATWENIIKQIFIHEGFTHIYEYTDQPNTKYEEHAHMGKVALYITAGSVTFSGGINKELKVGERFDVPVGVKHSAIVGANGCSYIVAEEIEGDS